MSHIITLTTDFGNKDHYVGSMKGAILRINPKVMLIDNSHHVPSFDVESGAYLIGASFLSFPRGTIHVVVVDPGVGSERRPILMCTENYFFIAPDNGVLSLVAERDGARAVYHLDNHKYFLDHLSATFHGRDIFGPVAAHLAAGVSPIRLGTKIEDYKRHALFEVRREDNALYASVIHIDHFGNVTTGFTFETFRHFIKNKSYKMKIKNLEFSELKNTYAEVEEGEPLMLIGSSGFLEFGINQESFATAFDVNVGTTVILEI